MKRSGAWLAVLALAGCKEGQRGLHMEDTAATAVHAPRVDRCTKVKDRERTTCDEHKEAALKYIRNLTQGDNMCVEGGFGEELTKACKVRGTFEDGNNEGILVMIHDPAPESHWKGYSERKVWFDNAALVDQFLADKGYE